VECLGSREVHQDEAKGVHGYHLAARWPPVYLIYEARMGAAVSALIVVLVEGIILAVKTREP